jgi:peptidoglycan/xylan/chitin deacetylase (PgdA/CDA1 family)
MKLLVILCFFVQFFFVFLCPLHCFSADSDKIITVVFRYDDPSAISNWELEDKIIGLFYDVDKRCTFAVVPNHTTGEVRSITKQGRKPLGAERAKRLRDAVDRGAIDIALHGFTHQTVIEREDIKYATEFSGLSFDEQYKKIATGKGILDDVLGFPVLIFVPPFNTFDSVTLSVLHDTGFACLSNDTNGKVPLGTGLKIVPATTRITELQDVVRAARKSNDSHPMIVVLFHDYDFKEANPESGRLTFSEFEDVVRWVAAQNDINILSVGEAIGADIYLSSFRFYLNYRLPNVLPGFLKIGENRIFYSAEHLKSVLYKAFSFYLFVLTSFSILSFIITNFFDILNKYQCDLSVTGGVLLIFLSMISFSDGDIYFRGLFALIAMFGVVLGPLFGVVRKRLARPLSDINAKEDCNS